MSIPSRITSKAKLYPFDTWIRIQRKIHAEQRKHARILARQVRRAGVIMNQAPPLLHNGKAAR